MLVLRFDATFYELYKGNPWEVLVGPAEEAFHYCRWQSLRLSGLRHATLIT